MEPPSQRVHLFEGGIVYSVSNLTKRIKEDLEADEELTDVWVEGEISGFKLHPPSGHYYFSLKDERAQLSCAAFRNAAANIKDMKHVKEGSKVLVKGTIGIYEARGQYNLRVKDIRVMGKGELYILYEEMKAKLEKEGLFALEHKKPLPIFPHTIGVVTSESGAALQDILNVLKRRYPLGNVLLCPAKVQGEGAAEEISNAVKAIDATNRADVIIVGRGGGSMEDLWCFNEEKVARAIFECKTPVLSAVGHEIDYTIADFVADKRAPTPSAAAELVAPNVKDLATTVKEWDSRINGTLLGLLETRKDTLSSLLERLDARSPRTMVEQGHTRCDELEERLDQTIKLLLERLNTDTTGWMERLENAAIPATLERGYILARDEKKGLVTSITSLEEGKELLLKFKDGEATVKVISVKEGDETDE